MKKRGVSADGNCIADRLPASWQQKDHLDTALKRRTTRAGNSEEQAAILL
jgi:hypothetical protein